MSRRYFGTDDVRATVGEAPIAEFVLRLGFAAGEVARRGSGQERPAVLIGKDTRIWTLLELRSRQGFAAAGVDVAACGPMPTPAVACLTRALRLSAGIVISASLNAPTTASSSSMPRARSFLTRSRAQSRLRSIGAHRAGSAELGQARR